MSQEKQTNTQDELLKIQIAREQMLLEKENLEFKRLKKLDEAELEQENSQKAARKQNAENAEIARQKTVANQTYCMHVKPSGKTAIMGQKLHGGPDRKYMYTFVCGVCNKEFNEYTTPPMLRPDPFLVGGPDV